MMREKRCGNCSAWVQDPGQLGENKQGICHAALPKVFQLIAQTPAGPRPVYQSAFPPMPENEFCRDGWQPLVAKSNGGYEFKSTQEIIGDASR